MSRARCIAATGFMALIVLSGGASAETPPINRGALKAPAPSARAPAVAGVAAPAPSPMELVYAPIQPCRAFFPPQQIAATKSASFQITGAGDFTSQGGPASGCGVPASATAVSISLTAKSASEGYLTAYADGAPRPATRSLAYRPSAYETTGAIVPLSADGKMAVYARQAAYVFGEVTGYYAPQIQVYMNSDGTAYSATTRIVSTAKLSTGSYQIDTDRNLQLCSVHANIAGGNYYVSAYPTGNAVFVFTWALVNGTPTPTDLYHNVFVSC